MQRQRWELRIYKPEVARSHQKVEEARKDASLEPSEGI